MKVKFLATGQAPEHYSFEGEKITAYKDGMSDTFDLSMLQEGDRFEGVETNLYLPGSQVIRDAERVGGELYVTLCQSSQWHGHWRGTDRWMDSDEYDPDNLYIKGVVDNG